MVAYYKSLRIGKDGKPGWRIVDDSGKIVNMNPGKEELKGLEEEYYRRKSHERYKNEELLDFLRKFDKDNGRSPVQLDFECIPGYPSSMTYRNRFGSWNKALKLAGLYVNYYANLSDEELLDYLVQYCERNGRVPIVEDFNNDSRYPNFSTYQNRFGSWSNALKLVGLDVDTMVEKGVLDTSDKKARLAEKIILDHFEKNPVDLSGENKLSPCDGICPNGKTYDVKSSRLIRGIYWQFDTCNKYKEEIEIYYFLAFNEDYTKLEYAWRIPGEIVESDNFYIGTYGGKFNVGNMIEYEITDKLKKIEERGI